MIKRSPTRWVAVCAAIALVMASACGGDDDDDAATASSAVEPNSSTSDAAEASTETTTASTEGAGAPAADGWTATVDDCVDPAAATAPIEGTVTIGMTAPLSGGPAASAFSPVATAFQTYVDYANENELLPGYTLEVKVADDQFDPALTPNAVNGLLDEGVHVMSSMIGTANNLAARDLLNEECVPQLLSFTGSTAVGDVANYPWTGSGAFMPFDDESRAYAAEIARQHGEGATVALFTVSNETGQVYKDAFGEIAAEAGLEVVEEQTIAPADTAPPAAQVAELAEGKPDAILAVPLGAGCVSFLTELANVKATDTSWNPGVFLTSTCASALTLAAAGPAADGIYTVAAGGMADVADPAVASRPAAAEYLSYMESKSQRDIVTSGSLGWTSAEITVEILKQAANSTVGLTRQSIMEAARNFEYTPSLIRDGVVYRMSGEEDGFLAEAVQVIQYDAGTTLWTDIGQLNTSYENS